MAIKTFSHAVVYNGKFYPANTPIKVRDVKSETPAPTKAKEKVKKP